MTGKSQLLLMKIDEILEGTAFKQKQLFRDYLWTIFYKMSYKASHYGNKGLIYIYVRFYWNILIKWAYYFSYELGWFWYFNLIKWNWMSIFCLTYEKLNFFSKKFYFTKFSITQKSIFPLISLMDIFNLHFRSPTYFKQEKQNANILKICLFSHWNLMNF